MSKKKEAILKAALELIVKHGLHAVTMADIAQKAHTGIGTIYRNFKDKDDIVQQIWIWQKKQESQFIFNQYNENDSVKNRFWFLWKKVIHYFLLHQNEYYFSYHFSALPILTKEVHSIAMKDFLTFDKMFQEGIQQNLFKKNLTPRQLRLYTFGSINGWLLWSFDIKTDFTEEQINQFIQMAWDSITN